MKITHILVETYTVVEPNPYWSANNSNIEPKTLENTKTNVTHFYSVGEVKNYIEKNPNTLEDSSKYAFYRVEQIVPTRTVTIDVSL